jgi:hypothetical protein
MGTSISVKISKRMLTITALIIPPINPSIVLFGLISGQSFLFPIALPVK